MRQLPEDCESCKRQIATLETCVLPDGNEKRGAEVTLWGTSGEQLAYAVVPSRGDHPELLERAYERNVEDARTLYGMPED